MWTKPGQAFLQVLSLWTCPQTEPPSSEEQPESLKTGQMMDDSDDDFKELCTSFLQRVKKNASKEVSRERKTQKASDSTQIRSKLKRTKQTAPKKKTLQGTTEEEPPPGSRVPRTKSQRATKLQGSEPALTVNGKGGVPASAADQPVPWEGAQNTCTEGAPNSHSRSSPPSCLTTAAVPSPSKPRTAELVLQRMQQFKRADPERLKHATEECTLGAALGDGVPEGPLEERVAGTGMKSAFLFPDRSPGWGGREAGRICIQALLL